MRIDSRLENYLATLDRALAAIPVSDRADIVTEIKSHVLAARERNPELALDAVLAALGDPEVVANRYLLERGLKPARPPVSPVVKWIVIAFLGTFGILVAATIALLVYFSPVIKIDDKEDRVTLLGGMITVDDDNVAFGGRKLMEEEAEGRVEGALVKGQKVLVDLANSKIVLRTAKDRVLRWSCRGTNGPLPTSIPAPSGAGTGQEVRIDFGGQAFLACEMDVPEGVIFSLKGANGKLELDRPRFSLDAEIGNGKILVKRYQGARYEYDIRVKNGKIDAPDSDSSPEYKIALRLMNGKVSVK